MQTRKNIVPKMNLQSKGLVAVIADAVCNVEASRVNVNLNPKS